MKLEKYELHISDAGVALEGMVACSVDSLVCDPPAGISFMGKEWDHNHGGRVGWCEAFASIFSRCLRVLKPGAFGLVWALPRTSHWTACALEDAGFEVRDRVSHFFGTGFPKSLNVEKAIKEFADWNKVVAMAAERWKGYGTALKPAIEDWWLVRKPLDGTVANNILEWGTGALNIDGCRIGSLDAGTTARLGSGRKGEDNGTIYGASGTYDTKAHPAGRWPAHLVLDEEAAAALDEQSGVLKSGEWNGQETGATQTRGVEIYGKKAARPYVRAADSGGASRFFYVAKPGRKERDAGCEDLPARSGGEATHREDGSDGLKSPRVGAGRTGGAKNFHPTVKSISLMRWLCRLVTPTGGLVLDPFMGSGSTGCAALAEGFRFIGIERDPEYAEIARRRIAHWAEIRSASAK